ncbi:MAG: ABC transporter permease [bacterium]
MIRGLRPGILRLFRLPLRGAASIHADVDEEFAAMRLARIDALVAMGVTPEEARARVLECHGNLAVVRDQLRDSAERRERRMRFATYIDDLVQDIRYAARGLWRRPSFAIVAVLTLAIGIGATTAIFSAVNTLLLYPLPYEHPDELMRVSLTHSGRDGFVAGTPTSWSFPKYQMFAENQKSFADMSLFEDVQFTITGADAERVKGEYVGANYLRTLGLRTSMGRDFDPSVDKPLGAANEVLISANFWRRRFNADPRALNSTLSLDNKVFTIIGVTPEFFQGLNGGAEVFVPVASRASSDLPAGRSEFLLVARRKPGVSANQADAAVSILAAEVSRAFPNPESSNLERGVAEPLDGLRVAPLVRQALLVIFGAVTFVLLIACVNVANVLLGRAASRRREIAIRVAVGAGRGRLVRLLLTESMMLALAGGVASLGVAWAGVAFFRTIDPSLSERAARVTHGFVLGTVGFSDVSFDWRTLGFTFALVVLVGVAFGLAPALHSTSLSLGTALNDGIPMSSSGRHRRRSSGRRVLVVAETALALVLLAGSGLMVRSLAQLLAVDLGFDARHLLTMRLTVPPNSLVPDSLPGFYAQVLEHVRAVPGVTDAAINNCMPLSGGCVASEMRRLDHPDIDLDHAPAVRVVRVSPEWFTTVRVALKGGRGFTLSDHQGSQPVVLVNEAASRAIFPDGATIGKHVEVGAGGIRDGEIIGIVGNVRQRLDSAEGPTVYVSYLQSPSAGMIIYARTSGDAAAVGPSVRQAIRAIAPQYPIYDMAIMSAHIASATAQQRLTAALLAAFALTALTLAAVGIYGVTALSVSTRTREIGIRIALGADPRQVQRSIIGEGIILAAIGTVIGIAGALLCTRALQSLLFELSPGDPATYVVIVGLITMTATLASWLPARRAAKVDPVTALRAE